MVHSWRVLAHVVRVLACRRVGVKANETEKPYTAGSQQNALRVWMRVCDGRAVARADSRRAVCL
jgi:hypothetical protein